MRWLFLALAVLSFHTLANGQSQPPSPRPAEAVQKPQAQSKGSPEQPAPEQKPIFRADEKKAAKQGDQNNQEPSSDWWTRSEWWLVGFNGLLVVVVFLQWFWMTRQEIWMRRSFKAARLAANAGIAQARASEQTIKTMEDTAKRQLRAYLGIGGGEVYRLPNNVLRGVVEIKNFGETPAHKVTPAITGELRKPGDKRPFNDPDFMPHNQPIAPTMHWTFGHEFLDMSSQDFQEVLTDKKLVYIWGHVKYEDIYGEPHILRFRFRNVVKVLVATEDGPAIQKWYFYPEDDGNEAT